MSLNKSILLLAASAAMVSLYYIALAWITKILPTLDYTPSINNTLQVIVIATLITLQLKSSISPKKNTSPKTDQTEHYYRQYLLYPFRKTGQILNDRFKKNKPALLIISALLLLLFVLNTFHSMILASVSCIILSIGANRSPNTKSFLLWIILFEAFFVTLIINCQGMSIALLHSLGISLVLLMLKVITIDTEFSESNQQIEENKLSIRVLYLGIGLLMLIGIPGTISFISEFYLINTLIANHDYTVALLFIISNIALSICIMHALQLYVFSENYSHLLTKKLRAKEHIIFISVIAINVFFGVIPNSYLNLLQ
jgi:hypothetical protein